MKKVYTVTFHSANNYGAMLQAYALQKFLDSNYDTKILNYNNSYIASGYRVFRLPSKNLKKSVINFMKDVYNFPKEYPRCKKFNKFREKLKFTNVINNKIEVENILDCDALVVGSDQVWNPVLTGGVDLVYFLDIDKPEVKKISYAASCGSIDILNKYSSDFSKYLSSFDHISVREKSLKESLIKDFKINAELVIDPTLLLTKKDWVSLIDKPILEEKYIFAYSVGNANDKFYESLKFLSNKTGYKVVYFDKRDKKGLIVGNKKSFYSAGPVEFLNLLYNSEYVVTTSFHGVALSSILNKKMFICLSTYPDRLITLIDKLNISDFIVNDSCSLEKIFDLDINWEVVNTNLDIERNFSANWLISSIENGDTYE